MLIKWLKIMFVISVFNLISTKIGVFIGCKII